MKYRLAVTYLRVMRPVAKFGMKVAVYVCKERGRRSATEER